MEVDLLKNLKVGDDEFDETSKIAEENKVGLSGGKSGVFSAGEKEEVDEKIKLKQKKQKILRELDKELYYLGKKEGKVTECRDPEDTNVNAVSDCRGVLRKRIKSGLIMEYVFTSQERGIKNFHLNNVKIDLGKIKEEKLIKLLIIIKFFNQKYREADKGKKSDGEKELSTREKEELAKEKREESKRKLVLGKL
ncbi:hypothetical protein DRH27_02040 [Candidatus Falkowbacteria bacterium]|nr:MAG: hypothetical protein DRH27_02040 [Candidatus Falkowbacteria bacterium]